MFRFLLVFSIISLFASSCLPLDDDVVEELKGSDQKEWIFITRKDGLAEDTVTTMLKDSKGYYWFGHLSRGITRWDGINEYIKFSAEQGLSSNYIFRIVEAPDGRIWVATSKGYNIIDGSTVVASEYYNYAITDIVFPAPGKVWLSSQVGIYVFSDAGNSLITDTDCQFCSVTLKLLVDSENNVWASSFQDIRRYNAATEYSVDKRYYINPRDGFQAAQVTEIFEDENNNIYGGSFFGEFNTFLLKDSGPQFLDFNAGSAIAVSAITTYNNQLWAATLGAGVIKTNGTSLSLFASELPSPIVSDLMNDGQSIWIATFGGVAKYTAK